MSDPFDSPDPVLPSESEAVVDGTTGGGRRTWGRWVSLLVVVALIAGALLVTRHSSPPALSATQIVTRAETASSKQTAMTFKLTGSELVTKGSSFQVVGQPISFNGQGEENKATDRGSMTLTMKVSTLSIKIREVLSHGSIYMNFAALTPYLPTGQSWVKVPASAVGTGSSLSNLESSPLLLKLLKDREAKVSDAGRGTVDGRPVDDYKVTLDAKAMASLGSPLSSAGIIDKGGYVLTLAIDGQDVLRQLTVSVHESLATTHVAVTLAYDVTRYGPPVSVTIPPTRKVDSLNGAQFKRLELKSQTAPPSLV